MEVWKTEDPCVNFEKHFPPYEIYTWTLCNSYLHEKQTSRIQSLNKWIFKYLSCDALMLHDLYYSIVSGMEGEIPIEIELGTVVRQIEVRKGQQKVVVRTTDLKQHFADAVVLALPLGVLKNQSVLFDPLLPRNWYTTINKLGMFRNFPVQLHTYANHPLKRSCILLCTCVSVNRFVSQTCNRYLENALPRTLKLDR